MTEERDFLDELLIKLPPPVFPVAGSGEWPLIEKRLGFLLPTDYKKFVEAYGIGTIGKYVRVFSPFCLSRHLNLYVAATELLGALNALEAVELIPFPRYPTENGLYPTAITSNGDILYWLMGGPANRWPIAINESRGPTWELHELQLVPFLLRYARGELSSQILPPLTTFEDPVRFTPYEDTA